MYPFDLLSLLGLALSTSTVYTWLGLEEFCHSMTEVGNRHINQRSNGIIPRMGRVGERSEGMAKRPSGSFGTERAGKPCHRRAR